MAPRVQYRDNVKDLVRELKRAGVHLQVAAADSLNVGAEFIDRRYKAILHSRFTIRNRFTLGAIRVLQATGVRRNGQLRQASKINAIVGVRKRRGGNDHSLAAHEEGKTVRGLPKTGGKVPVPLRASRTGKNDSRPIAGRFRVDRRNVEQHTELNRLNPRQQYAALRDRARRGAIDTNDMHQTNAGIFKVGKRRITRVRSSEKRRIRIRKIHPFRDAVQTLSQRKMGQAFIVAARRLLRQMR